MRAFAYPAFPDLDSPSGVYWAAQYVRRIAQHAALLALWRGLHEDDSPIDDAMGFGVVRLVEEVAACLDRAVRNGGLLLCWVPDGAGQGAA